MAVVKMCGKDTCNGAFYDEFEALMKDKGITLKKGCIGQCKKTTPMCKVDKELLTADTVKELADLVVV